MRKVLGRRLKALGPSTGKQIEAAKFPEARSSLRAITIGCWLFWPGQMSAINIKHNGPVSCRWH